MKGVQITKASDYMKPIILIQRDSSEILTNSSIMLIKGEVGSGKSRLAMNMMKGLLDGKDDLNMFYKECPDNRQIIYFSTEMNKYHLQRRLIKVLENVDESKHNKLLFFDIMSLSIEDRFNDIYNVFTEYSPYVIIIDQLADLVVNINDIDPCQLLLNKLLHITEKYDCSIIAIVHQNEDSTIDSKARGHLGSITEQKVVSSIAIADTRTGFKVKSTKLREGKQINISAIFNENTDMLIESASIEDRNVEFIDSLSFPILNELLLKKAQSFYGIAERTASNKIKELTEQNYLVKTKIGKNTQYDRVQSN